jgi:hypothetical protein
MKNISDKNCKENQNTSFVFNKLFFPENRAIYGIMWKKNASARQATDDNFAHAICVLDT